MCVLCLDGAGINHDGPFQLIQSRVMEVGPERWETRRIPCFCECHAIEEGPQCAACSLPAVTDGYCAGHSRLFDYTDHERFGGIAANE